MMQLNTISRRIVLSGTIGVLAVGLAQTQASVGETDASETETAQVEHSVVYAGNGEFAGWPANEGLWSWGDEVLVAFNVTRVKQRDDYHNVDQQAYMWVNFARSMDGGETWRLETHPEVSIPGGFDGEGNYVQQSGYPPIVQPMPCPGGIDFTHPDFALKARNDRFWYSLDRGHHWKGPYELPRFDQRFIDARTNYLVVDSRTLVLFCEATNIPREQGEHLRTMVVQTTDGGRTFQRIAWLTPDPLTHDIQLAKHAYACMPGVVQFTDDTMLAAVRWRIADHKWTDLVASTDGGRTWDRRSVIFDRNNNPASLVPLGGGRLAAIYGYRNEPYGIRARISEDGGRTWSRPFILRDDGREWDLGYVRAARRSDGRILIVYYYTTDSRPDEFIASTIWDPPIETTPARQFAIRDDGTLIESPIRFDPADPGGVIGLQHPLLNPGRGDFAISGRFQTPPNDGGNRVILDNLNGLSGFSVMVGRADRSYRGKLVFTVAGPGENDDVSLFSNGRVDDGRPHRFTVTVEGGTMRMVVDGVAQQQVAAYGAGTTATAPPQAPVTIGGNFVGTIDHLRVRPGTGTTKLRGAVRSDP